MGGGPGQRFLAVCEDPLRCHKQALRGRVAVVSSSDAHPVEFREHLCPVPTAVLQLLVHQVNVVLMVHVQFEKWASPPAKGTGGPAWVGKVRQDMHSHTQMKIEMGSTDAYAIGACTVVA